MNHYRLSRAVHSLVFIFLFLKGQTQTVQPLYAGTKTPYVEPRQNYTDPPKGFHAIFVNYVGRHGARFMTKSGADRQALDMLEEAERDHALSDTGRLIKRSVEKMLSIQKTGYEKITLLGAMEQKAIGQRIYDLYQTAFSGRGINVQYTFKTRTQQSAEAFLIAYRKYSGVITTEKNTDPANTELRFYDLSPGYANYKNGPDMRRSLDSLNADPKEEQTVKRVCLKLFTTSYFEHLINDRKASQIVENLYDLYAATFAVKNEMKNSGFTSDSINIGMAFTEEDLRWLDFKSGAADFMEKGPGRDSLGVQVKVAVPLLADFLATTDSAILHKNCDARFRFTHAEAISPFATLLSLSSASTPSASVFDYAWHWRTEEIIPLSANIQWILYSNGSTYLVKVLLNEKEMVLPIPFATGPYYDWSEFRKFYLDKLMACKASPRMNMLEYLKTLKN